MAVTSQLTELQIMEDACMTLFQILRWRQLRETSVSADAGKLRRLPLVAPNVGLIACCLGACTLYMLLPLMMPAFIHETSVRCGFVAHTENHITSMFPSIVACDPETLRIHSVTFFAQNTIHPPHP